MAIGILAAAVVFLVFLAYTTWRLSQTNDWSEIVRHVGPPVGWLVLALATALVAVVADRSEKRHAVVVAAVGATAAGAPCTETIGPCSATIVAPSIAMIGEQVPIDLSVSCPKAKPQQMPAAKAAYGAQASSAVESFEGAKTTYVNERVWRWFVQFPNEGEQPADVRMSFVGDPIGAGC